MLRVLYRHATTDEFLCLFRFLYGIEDMRQHWVVEGRVQGVGFRQWVARGARTMGVSGWIRNLADGAVELEAEGDAEPMASLERKVRQGPPHAKVARVRAVDVGTDALPTPFEVRRHLDG